MKKAIITILGTSGVDREGNVTTADYKCLDNSNFSKPNFFFVLIKKFRDYEIISIATNDAKKIHNDIAKKINIDIDKYLKNLILIDEKDYEDTFNKINEVLESFDENDEVIIDVTHGFRHLPILMIVDVLIQNIHFPKKINKILFAKEIEKFKKYEVVDLKSYLDLANISYALTSFDKNYTVASNIKTTNQKYNEFLDELDKFSRHILANSLKELKNITQSLSKTIDGLLQEDKKEFKVLYKFLNKLKKHIDEIHKFSNLKEDYKRLYYFSKNMLQKGYLLNSVTLLSEAVGMYAKEELKKINSEVKNFIEEFEKKVKNNEKPQHVYSAYTLSSSAKKVYKDPFRNDLFFNKILGKKWNERSKKITQYIRNYKYFRKDLKALIKNVDNLRNNLAHGNSSKPIKEVKREIEHLLREFNLVARIENV